MKRILITLLTIQLLVFGSSSAWAQSPIELEGISTESSEETQDIDISVEQDQNVDTGDTADEIKQEQEVIIEHSQDQSTHHEEESSEETETVVDQSDESIEEQVDSQFEDETTTEQEENNETNQTGVNGSNGISEDSKSEDKTTLESNESYNQEQTVEIVAGQKQKVTGADKVEADQEQDVTLEYSQYLEVTQTEGQSQHSKIITEQDQSITSDDDTDYVEQTLKTIIDAKQVGEVNLEEKSHKAIQETEVTTTQQHKAETSGDATIQQEQSVEATATNENTSSENLSIKAKASNGVEIIKGAAKTIVRVIQSIFIDDQKIEEFNKEFIVGKDAINQSQEYSHTFAWGTLYVVNNVLVDKMEDQDVYSLLDSVIRLVFSLPKEKPVEDDNSYDSDGDGGSTDEEEPVENEPHNPDSDGDGGSTDEEEPVENEPHNPDSDGDGGSTDEEEPVENEPHNPDFDGDGGSKDKEELVETDPSTPYWDGNGLLNNEERVVGKGPNNRDTDGDRVPDYLEEKKFYTNPLKADTDEDGLSDYFEIIYHSSTSFYFSLESMVYEPAPILKDLKEKWIIEPEKLNPLNKDSDYDGITDNHENFDHDEFDHAQEQFHDTNPYKKDDPSIYYGSFVE